MFPRVPSVGTGTVGGSHWNGHDWRCGTRGRRTRRGSVGFESSFQVRLSVGYVSRVFRVKRFGYPRERGSWKKKQNKKKHLRRFRSVWRRDRFTWSLHATLIICRGKRSGKTVRIVDNKVAGKSQARPFPTAEVIELRRLADEYKVIRGRCFVVLKSKFLFELSQASPFHAVFVHLYANRPIVLYFLCSVQLLDWSDC